MANIGCGVVCVADALAVSLVFGPLVVAYWRGTWALLDIYLLPHDIKVSSWTSLLLGTFICSLFTLLQTVFQKRAEKCNIVLWVLCTRCYTYVFGLGIVNFWRGIWNILNEYTGTGVVSSLTSFVVGIGLLMLLRVSRTVHAPPCCIDYDVGSTYFKCGTRFQTKAGCTERYLLDVLLTSFIIHGLVVFYWRGLYEFQNKVLIPGHHEYSALASLLMGYGTSIVIFIIQIPLSRLSAYLDKKPFMLKLILEDLYQLLFNTSGVCIWRGVWKCCDIYILPDEVVWSAWFTHVLGQFSLMVCLVGNSVIARGCELDGSYKNGEGINVCHSYYKFFSEYFAPEKPHRLREDQKSPTLLHEMESSSDGK